MTSRNGVASAHVRSAPSSSASIAITNNGMVPSCVWIHTHPPNQPNILRPRNIATGRLALVGVVFVAMALMAGCGGGEPAAATPTPDTPRYTQDQVWRLGLNADAVCARTRWEYKGRGLWGCLRYTFDETNGRVLGVVPDSTPEPLTADDIAERVCKSNGGDWQPYVNFGSCFYRKR